MIPALDDEFRREWRVLLTGFLGMGLALSTVPTYTIGVFAPHLRQAFGWSMGEIMAGHMIMTVGIALIVPFVGALADRIGVRPVALFSLAAYALVYMSLGLGTGSIALYFATCLLLAAVGSGSLAPVWIRSINASFERRKGLALGIAAMGTGLFGSLLKVVASGAVALFGWRGAYLAVGCLPVLIAWPVAFLFLRDRPAGASRTGAAGSDGLSLRAALSSYRFWVLALAFPIVSFAIIGPIPNIENILRTHAIAERTIIGLAGILGVSMLGGRVIGGVLIDRIWAPAVACPLVACPALACLILSWPVLDARLAGLAIFLIGFGVGAELDLVGFFVARYFGQAHYAAIYGIFFGLTFLAGGIGPWAFGRTFDLTGSYASILRASAALLAISSTSFLLLGRYRFRTAAPA